MTPFPKLDQPDLQPTTSPTPLEKPPEQPGSTALVPAQALQQSRSSALSSCSNPGNSETSFLPRHIGPNADEIQQMLDFLGFSTLEALIDTTVPPGIRLGRSLQLPPARSEYAALKQLQEIAAQNQIFRSFIGMGYADCITPR